MSALTARQRQVLRLTAAGYTSTQTGHRLGIDARTVSRHLGEAYKTLGAHDRAHAVALAIHHGHITLAELAAIAQESTARDAEGPREPVDAPQGGREASRAARDGRGAAKPSQAPAGEPEGRAA
ncbi:helix-turn-helix domain-containing protein [Streptomyces sp. NPDC060027]|uniref:helix-turn-helix domain-containing protein n=1 Tax=Streptomyces sp. NPDC060027 TaxID=3347040 RepID=UPI0036AB3FFF